MIRIVPYDPRWPADFEAVAERLGRELAGLIARIDHIGSTAVPGLAAKDRIDVQVGVEDLGVAGEITARLGRLGYRVTDIAGDHVPFGSDGDAREWAKAFVQTPSDARPVGNVHIREVGRANWRYALLFRDYLREHPAAVAAYAELKRRLAAVTGDIDTYSDVKDPAVDLIMVAAEAWAEASGWRPDR